MGIQCKQYRDEYFKYSQAQWDRQAVKDIHGYAPHLNTYAHSCADTAIKKKKENVLLCMCAYNFSLV